jgi:hypothetical protein
MAAALDPKEFVRELEARLERVVQANRDREVHMVLGEIDRAEILVRLGQGRYNEIRNARLCGKWMSDSPIEWIDVQLNLAKQALDEARHYKLLTKRLIDIGMAPTFFEPIPEWIELFSRHDRRETVLEKIAGMQFVGEGLTFVGNARFIERAGQTDPQTVALYRDPIQRDETFHASWPKRAFARYATTAELQDRIRDAVEAAIDYLPVALAAYHRRVEDMRRSLPG